MEFVLVCACVCGSGSKEKGEGQIPSRADGRELQEPMSASSFAELNESFEPPSGRNDAPLSLFASLLGPNHQRTRTIGGTRERGGKLTAEESRPLNLLAPFDVALAFCYHFMASPECGRDSEKSHCAFATTLAPRRREDASPWRELANE